MPETPYRPIDCSLHDRIEAAASLRKTVLISYTGEGGEPREVTDRIADWFTADGAEFMRTAAGHVICLDRILAIDGVAFNTGSV